MQYFLPFDQIEQRRDAINLTRGRICALSYVSEATYSRAKGGQIKPMVETLQQLGGALESEEHRLLEHLISLHPARARELLSLRGSGDTGGGETQAGIPQDPPFDGAAAGSSSSKTEAA